MYAEALAFRLLVRHLQSVSDKASNIDVMCASGMCRNCVAKWYHAGTHMSGKPKSYEEACQVIYGESYGSWKKKYQKPATQEQLERYEATKPWHAKHEKSVAEWAATQKTTTAEPCCYDVEEEEAHEVPAKASQGSSTTVGPIRVGVLTVSDRASRGVYEDLSGPSVVGEVRKHATIDTLTTAIVPDEKEAIQTKIGDWADSSDCDLVLTTGGTGFGARDVTPEATAALMDKLAPGIINIVHERAFSSSNPTTNRQGGANDQLDSLLSRAVAGVRGSCLVVNLPGRPEAAKRNLALLMPTLLRAVAQLKK